MTDRTPQQTADAVRTHMAAHDHAPRMLGIEIVAIAPGRATATMTVSYRIGLAPAPRVVQLQAPLAGPTPVDAAQAWSALVGQLADRIVTDLPVTR